MFEWAFAGVDHTLPGNGGRDCVDFIPLWQRFAESGIACVFAACCIKYAYKRVTLPEKVPPANPDKVGDCGKRILLVLMCLTFGIELGFKFATRQFIWIFNPCHVTSMIQIYILAAPPGRLVTAMFRIHLHMLTGAPIAILFPVINTRLLPFETEVYFVQHFLMMIIPFYLIYIGGVYRAEKLGDMSWAALSLGWLYFFHFVPLNYLAVLSHVNLNNMLCPAVSDPFYGRGYRLCAMVHQMILIPVIGKLIVKASFYFKLIQGGEVTERKVFVADVSGKIENSDKKGASKGIHSDRVSDNVSDGVNSNSPLTKQVLEKGEGDSKTVSNEKYGPSFTEVNGVNLTNGGTSGELEGEVRGVHSGESEKYKVNGNGVVIGDSEKFGQTEFGQTDGTSGTSLHYRNRLNSHISDCSKHLVNTEDPSQHTTKLSGTDNSRMENGHAKQS